METLDLTTVKRIANQAQEESSEAKVTQLAASLVPRVLPIDIKYTTPEGAQKSATISSKILTSSERIHVARAATNLLGMQWDSAPAITRSYCWAIAWLSQSIENPPRWFSLAVAEDEALLFTVFEEVQRHEERYFRGSADPSDATAAAPRIRVTSAVSPQPAGGLGESATMGSVTG